MTNFGRFASGFNSTCSYSSTFLLKSVTTFTTVKLPLFSVLVAAPFVMVQSAQANDNIDISLNSSMNTVTEAQTNQVAADRITTDLFLQCAALQTDAARLACYDKVVTGESVTVGQSKRPLDLVESFKASIDKGKPKIVLADNNANTNVTSLEMSGSKNFSNDNNKHNDNSQTVNRLTTESALTQSSINTVQVNDDVILANVGVSPEEVAQYTPLSLAYDLDKNSERGVFSGRPYKPIYLLPVFGTFDPNRSPETPTQEAYTYTYEEYDPVELKAQISLKTKVMEDVFDTSADVWFGYSQQMHWQVYNEDNSRPFRATDYMPEFFITQPVTANLPLNGRLRMLGAGAIHHSNGQSDPLSRSWNRLYLMGGAEWGRLTVLPRVWAHVKNETDAKPSDNPDITDYYGHGEIKTLYDFGKGKTLAAKGRYNFGESNGAIEVNYIHPLTTDVHGFIQLFHGYGESIIDYNHKSTSLGLGVTLNDWKGL